MITVSILFIFFGCFAMYNSSKKVQLRQDISVEKWLQGNSKQSKIIGIISLIIGLITAIKRLEITTGFMFWLVSVMSILSLIIALYPLKKINYKYLSLLFVVLFLIEVVTV